MKASRIALVSGGTILIVLVSLSAFVVLDLRPKEYTVPRGNVETLTEDIAVGVVRKLFMEKMNLRADQVRALPYQHQGPLLAQRGRHKNEGAMIWYISADGYDPSYAWHLHTTIEIRDNDILVSVSEGK